jgi:hypothetical protein
MQTLNLSDAGLDPERRQFADHGIQAKIEPTPSVFAENGTQVESSSEDEEAQVVTSPKRKKATVTKREVDRASSLYPYTEEQKL